MPIANSSPVTRSCSTPMELTSMKQYSQPLSTILARRLLRVMGSTVVLDVSSLSSST